MSVTTFFKSKKTIDRVLPDHLLIPRYILLTVSVRQQAVGEGAIGAKT